VLGPAPSTCGPAGRLGIVLLGQMAAGGGQSRSATVRSGCKPRGCAMPRPPSWQDRRSHSRARPARAPSRERPGGRRPSRSRHFVEALAMAGARAAASGEFRVRTIPVEEATAGPAKARNAYGGVGLPALRRDRGRGPLEAIIAALPHPDVGSARGGSEWHAAIVAPPRGASGEAGHDTPTMLRGLDGLGHVDVKRPAGPAPDVPLRTVRVMADRGHLPPAILGTGRDLRIREKPRLPPPLDSITRRGARSRARACQVLHGRPTGPHLQHRTGRRTVLTTSRTSSPS